MYCMYSVYVLCVLFISLLFKLGVVYSNMRVAIYIYQTPVSNTQCTCGTIYTMCTSCTIQYICVYIHSREAIPICHYISVPYWGLPNECDCSISLPHGRLPPSIVPPASNQPGEDFSLLLPLLYLCHWVSTL